MSIRAIPDGYHSITPGANLKDAPKAIEFFKKAFGAEELLCMKGPDGSVMHCEMKIGDSRFMFSDAIKEPVHTLSVMLYVQDSDAVFKRAVDAGATVKHAMTDMPWGDRAGRVVDPFGNKWFIATHKEDVSPEEIEKRMKKMGPPPG